MHAFYIPKLPVPGKIPRWQVKELMRLPAVSSTKMSFRTKVTRVSSERDLIPQGAFSPTVINSPRSGSQRVRAVTEALKKQV
jgi:hypothetical protein